MVECIFYELVYLQFEIFIRIFFKKVLGIFVDHRFGFKAAVDTFSTIEEIASSTDIFESIILGTYVPEVTEEEEEVDF